jgi:transposase-like protein
MEDELRDSYSDLIQKLKPEKIRERMIKRYLEIKNISQIAEEFSTTRRTVRKWIKRFLEGEPLLDRSKSPKNPKKHFDSKIREIIINFKKNRPSSGYSLLKKHFSEFHPEIDKIPSKTTVYKIWHEHGLLSRIKTKLKDKHNKSDF